MNGMRGMAYLHNEKLIRKLKADYKKVLPLSDIQTQWNTFRASALASFLSLFPTDIKDIILAPYEKLVNIYNKYVEFPITIDQNNELKKIFDYTNKYSNLIADFFMNHADELEISTCHYCETAYVNIYHHESGYRRQFDVEHVLDKGSCPLVALSLFNFTFSCQYCNSRLKGTNVLGIKKVPIARMSPTHKDYDFDNQVKIRVYPKTINFDYLKMHNEDKDKFELYFKTIPQGNDYAKLIKMFHLEERYRFHKVEALRLIQLYHKYPKSYLQLMSNALGGIYSANMISEDLFAEKFTEQHHRTFAKLRRDTLELCRKKILDTSIIDIKS